MKMASSFGPKKARIEIIPLIDVMFFLLAAFMLSSLALTDLHGLQMNLPSSTLPGKSKPDMIDLLIKRNGDLYVGETRYNIVDLRSFLSKRYNINSNVQVYIKADPASTHGMFINALDAVRQVGIANVSCAISPPLRPKR